MDLEQEFEKETGFEVYDKTNVKYNGAYVEWLESRIEQLTIPVVSQQSELLKGFVDYIEKEFDIYAYTPEVRECVKKYLETI